MLIGDSELLGAVARGDLGAVALLCSSESLSTKRLARAVGVALGAGEVEIADFLYEPDCALCRDPHGRTLLHAASSREAVDFALVDCAVDVGDFRGQTALHVASSMGRLDAVEALLDAGADVQARDFRRQTPADVAADDTVRAALLRPRDDHQEDLARHLAIWEVFFTRAASRYVAQDDWNWNWTWTDRWWIRIVRDDDALVVRFEDEATAERSDAAPTALAEDLEWYLVRGEHDYWVHEPTGHARWERPLLRCWADDQGDGCDYYLDLANHRTAWTIDDLLFLVGQHTAASLLSEDWIFCFTPANPSDDDDDDDYPGSYYHRLSTGESAWDLPWDDLYLS
eukprot:CAMPEP_0118899638 /NCGR_PEP_ID=MMETSP1166-20130328/6113_1 /TAXON_ID=1104430 /ORGANISM="Chrysoreinhardia sp, Strain CCMP3193" /LENGTH=340 /DNA_ID=CAMNT_0006838769 /DNA_START=60 /DNA_END=1082 /DNA_ORIENTATION=-